jgi:hypothetical protein
MYCGYYQFNVCERLTCHVLSLGRLCPEGLFCRAASRPLAHVRSSHPADPALMSAYGAYVQSVGCVSGSRSVAASLRARLATGSRDPGPMDRPTTCVRPAISKSRHRKAQPRVHKPRGGIPGKSSRRPGGLSAFRRTISNMYAQQWSDARAQGQNAYDFRIRCTCRRLRLVWRACVRASAAH